MNASQQPPQTPTTPTVPTTIPSPTPSTTPSTTTAQLSRPLLNRRFAHVLQPLCPLLSVETGLPHPAFPATLLSYHLLTDNQLDDLVHFYHQRTPGPNSLRYPMPIVNRYWAPATRVTDPEPVTEEECVEAFFDAVEREYHEQKMREVCRILAMDDGPSEDATGMQQGPTLEDKRRRFGRFMGLQGLESALSEGDMQAEMERWVQARLDALTRREEERDIWRSKGY